MVGVLQHLFGTWSYSAEMQREMNLYNWPAEICECLQQCRTVALILEKLLEAMGLAIPSAVEWMLLGLAQQHHISRGFELHQPSTSKSTDCPL